jgi:hypothetical protein
MSRISYDVEEFEPGGVIWLDEVEEERIDWLWQGYVPRRKITILDGDPGLGKSTLTLALAARRSIGDPMPMQDGTGDPPETTLIVSGEDDIADTIKPRLRAAGADMGRIALLGLRMDERGTAIPFSVPEDMARLEAAVWEAEATFVIVDPITAFLSERIQSHNDASIRKAMTPLAHLAQKTRAALVLIRHLNKDGAVTKALYRGGGSIGFSGSARSVLLVAEKPDADGVLVVAQTKTNLVRRERGASIEWRLVPWGEDEEIPRVEWLGPSQLMADDLLKGRDGRRDDYAQREAIDFLRTELASGPRRSAELLKEAAKAGITQSTLKRAKSKLDLHAYRSRNPSGTTEAWYVHLPEESYPDVCARC